MNINDQVRYQVESPQAFKALVQDQVSDQVWSQVRVQVWDQVLDEVLKIRAETWHLLYGIKTSKKVVDNVTNLVYNASMINKEKESLQ